MSPDPRSIMPPPDALPEPLRTLTADATWSSLSPHFGTRAAQDLAATVADRLTTGLPGLPDLPQLPSSLPALPALPQQSLVGAAAQQAADFAAAGLAPLRGAGEGLAQLGEGAARLGAGLAPGVSGRTWGDAVGGWGGGTVEPHFGSKAAVAGLSRLLEWASGLLSGARQPLNPRR